MPNKTEGLAPDDLIELSRAAVVRARNAVTVAKQFDRERQARAAADIRKLHENSELLFQRVQHTLARARKLLPSLPKGRR